MGTIGQFFFSMTLFVPAMMLSNLAQANEGTEAATKTEVSKKVEVAKKVETNKKTEASKKPESNLKTSKSNIVQMETSLGTIKIKLNPEKAPKSVENFLKYVDEGFYSGTIFHRVIPGFMIQGGGFTENLKEKATHPPIENEAYNGLKNVRGTIAMARTQIPDSATAQFYINVVDNFGLDFKNKSSEGIGYAVFGEVIKGMDIVDLIKAVKTVTKGMPDVPETAVIIKSVKRVDN